MPLFCTPSNLRMYKEIEELVVARFMLVDVAHETMQYNEVIRA